MLSVDQKLLDFCHSQTEHDGIVPALKNHLPVRGIGFLKESIKQLANGTLQA